VAFFEVRATDERQISDIIYYALHNRNDPLLATSETIVRSHNQPATSLEHHTSRVSREFEIEKCAAV